MYRKTVSMIFALAIAGSLQAVSADSGFPNCMSASSDSDGDGWGWENGQSCVVTSDNNSNGNGGDNGNGGESGSYTVTVRNLTYQQVFSPVMAVTHDASIALLQAGEPASDGITAIAEGGDTSVLQAALSGVGAVGGVEVSAGPLPFAQETSIDISGVAGQVVSVVSMLVNTNDALMFVDSLALPSNSGESVMAYAIAYDSGTETNDEICAHIPGPACGGVGGSPDDAGEGFVHVHRGLQGVGDLDAAAQGWLNPVAGVTVTRN